ncbi:hypothetical protein TRICI_006355 [Trichomonascus ciferrii]|uniref:DNA-directed RNA polymerase III subunit RPC9 n=1 Tax=Trichomonascus ciferrii TaxID=44093 RepID=A0A642UHR2_9ASCO|nr:hypothetical protein TRICI_006355 [Trichomonascus ciferrii]
MKVEAARDKFMTNLEVYEYISEVRERNKADMEHRGSEHLETVLIELQSYLRDRPTGNQESPQTQKNVEAFIRSVHELGIHLEKAEYLQLVNTAPNSRPVLYNLIEDIEQRLEETQMEQITNLCKQYLGFEPMPEMPDEE